MLKKFSTCILGSLFIATTLPSFANTHFVSENLSTYLRKGAGDQFKIAGTISAGEKVTILDRKGQYSLIRDSRNREGWILTSEISSKASAKELVPQLQQQVQELTFKLNNIDKDWQQRTAEMQRRTQQSDQQSSELLEQNSLLKRELEIVKNKNRDLEALQNAETREIMIQYFLYGGSVMFIGLLFGLLIPVIMPRRKRNNSWH